MKIGRVAFNGAWYYALIVAFALSPLYLWRSGLPQLSHIVAVIAVVMRILLKPRFYWTRGWGAGIAFVLYALVVAATVYARYMDVSTLLGPVYYGFNLAVFALIVTVSSEAGKACLKPVFWIHAGLLAGITVASLIGVGRVYSQTRAMGTFNDPNQMANWMVCSVCILATTGRALYGSWLPGLFAWCVAMVGVAFSASRSGSLGLLALAVVLLLAVVRDTVHQAAARAKVGLGWVPTLSLLLAATGMIAWTSGSDVITEVGIELGRRAGYLISRFEEIGGHDFNSSFTGRGYDRLWTFPEYLVFGAGEGATDRFAGQVRFLGEIHSSWAGLLFNYGIVGFGLFCVFVYSSLRRVRDPLVRLLLLGPFVYGFTTYNIRNWYLWVAAALLVGSSVAVGRETEPGAVRKSR